MKFEYPENSTPIPVPETDEERLRIEAVQADISLLIKQLE
jgi:hypothetical protein